MASPIPFGLRTPFSPKRWFPGGSGRVFTLLTALFLAVSTSAQPEGPDRDPCIFFNGTFPQTQYISSQADITKYLSCNTIYHSVQIRTTETTISFPGISALKWNLKINHSPNLTTISAPDLTSIGQDFVLDDLPLLVDLDFPVLQTAGRIAWTSLPSLQEIPVWKSQSITIPTYPSNATYQQTPRFIVSKTALTKLDYFAVPSFEQHILERDDFLSNVLAITDNRFLDQIVLGGLELGPKNLTVTGNSESLILTLSEMREVENATFSDLRGLSVPALIGSSGTIILRKNSFQKLSFPLFEWLPGSLVIEGNGELTELDFPKLLTVGAGLFGDLRVVGNERLEVIDGFDRFQWASGAMEFSGNISAINLPFDLSATYFPVVAGKGIYIDTTNPSFNCSYWRALNSLAQTNNRPFSCLINGKSTDIIINNTTTDSTGNPNADSNGGTSLTKDVSGVLIAVGVLTLAFTIGTFYNVWRRKKKQRARMAAGGSGTGNGEVELGNVVQRGDDRDAGVVRTADEDELGERPPVYSRVPKPGEVPPRYEEVWEEGTTASSGTRECAAETREAREGERERERAQAARQNWLELHVMRLWWRGMYWVWGKVPLKKMQGSLSGPSGSVGEMS